MFVGRGGAEGLRGEGGVIGGLDGITGHSPQRQSN
eukprot:COSAG02_NODE_40758_length_401_cov_5.132450_1_plen_34_part_10